MVSRRTSDTLERKIYFYRANIGNDEGGQPLTFDPVPALDVIDHLPFRDDNRGRYQVDADGNALSLRTISRSPDVTLQFGRIRRNGLPLLERAGEVSDLPLDANAGLFETIHVVFFPNNIVGAEYNHYGPRVSRLGTFLSDKSDDAVPKADFRPILRGDAAQQLDRLTDLRMLDFSMLPAYAGIVRQANNSFYDALEAAGRAIANPKSIQFVLKPDRQASQGFLRNMIGTLRNLVGSQDTLESADRLIVRGRCRDTDRVETIDLLKDQLISVKKIMRMNPRSRALEPGAAFQAIREAYAELRPQLELSASVSP